MSLKIKITSLLLSIVLGIIVAVFYFIYTSNIKTLEKQIRMKLEDLAVCTMDTLDRMLYERYSDIKIMAGDPVISSKESTPEHITKRLMEYREQLKHFVFISFFDLNLVKIAGTNMPPAGTTQEPPIWSKEVFEKGVISAASDISFNNGIHTAVIHFASPVRDKKGENIGVIVAGIPVDNLYNIMGTVTRRYKNDIKIDLVDKTGLLLFSNYNKKEILKGSLAEWEAIRTSIQREMTGSIRMRLLRPEEEKNEEAFFAFAHERGYMEFPGNKWTLIINMPVKTAFSPAFELRNKMLILLSPIFLFSVAMVFAFSHTLSKPILMLRNAAVEIGKGKLDVDLKIKSKDEIGELIDRFNKMAMDIRETTVSRDYVNNIIKSMNEILFVISPDGNIEKVNQAALDLLGYKKEELVGKSINLVFKEEPFFQRKDFYNLIRQGLLYNGFIKNKETTYVSKDGKRIPVLFSISGMRNNENNVTGIVCVAQDITERKQVEEKLLNQLNFQQALIDSIPVPVFYKNTEGLYLGCNSKFEEFIGLKRGQIIGKSVFDIAPVELAKTYHKMDSALFRNPGTQSYECTVTDSTGNSHNVIFHKASFQNPDGSPGGLVGAILDITDRKKAEEELQKNEEQFRSVVQSAYDAIIIANGKGDIKLYNNGACKIFGYTEEEVLNKPLTLLIPERYRKSYQKGLERVLLTGKSVSPGKIRQFYALKKDGTEFPIELTISHWNTRDGTFYTAIIRDITKRKALEEELHKLAATDPITGILNRRKMKYLLLREMNRAKRYKQSLSLIMFDIDHFKRINDHYGHSTGDSVIVAITAVVKNHLRSVDLFCRWGGEEFLILTPEANLREATELGERLRIIIHNHCFTKVGNVTVSFGVTQYREEDTIDSFLVRVDRALYCAKNKGRNKVETA